jgi:hypothetical protein
MPSQAMQDAIDTMRDRRKASAGQARRRWNSAAPPSPPGTAFTRYQTTCW